MVKLAIDIMGGDFAPLEIIKGVDLALEEYSDLDLILFGDEDVIKANLVNIDRVKVVHAPEKIDMGEQNPISEIRRNKNTSIVKAFEAVKDGSAAGVVTAGPTQGVVTAAHLIIRRIKGMKRTALAPHLPPLGGKGRLLLDVGANTELRSEHLHQLAQYATIYLREIYNIEKPLVGLVNVGSEPGKGRELELESYELLSNDPEINFFGNIEGKDVFATECDIILTDGFSGNLIMKTSEGVAKEIGKFLKGEIEKSFKNKLGYLLMKGVFKEFKNILNPDEVGGANLFGVNGVVVKAHGSSNAYAFSNAIAQARLAVEKEVVEKMKTLLASSGNDDE